MCKVFSPRAQLSRQTAPRTLAFELFSAQKILITPGSYRSVGTAISMGITQGYIVQKSIHILHWQADVLLQYLVLCGRETMGRC